MRRTARAVTAGLLALILATGATPASGDGLTTADPSHVTAATDAPDDDTVDEPPYKPHTPWLAPCFSWEDRCTVAPGTVKIAWTVDVDDDHPIDTIDVWLRRRKVGGTNEVVGRHRVDPTQTTVLFDGLAVGDQVTATVFVTGPGGHSSQSGLRFAVHDVTPTAPNLGIDDHTRPGRINVWVHPAIDVEFYGGELTYELQRRSGGVWSTVATGTWPSRTKLALPDLGCPTSTICSYRVRSRHPWGTSAWSTTASQRSLPVPTAPRLTARPAAAGRNDVTATATTIGQGTWYAPHRFELQRDTGAGWTAWSSGSWIADHPIVRKDTSCPISRVCRYRVRTRTAVGNSAWTTISQRSMGPPTAVRNATATSPKTQTVTLKWDAPTANAGRPVASYEGWSGGNRLWRGTSRSVTLTGQPVGKATYTVRAVNQWGNGPWVSRSVTVRR